MTCGDSEFGGAATPHNDDSDTDMQLLAEQDSSELQLQLENLRRENSNLRVQVDQAVALTQGIDELHQKNLQLSGKVRSLEQTNTDISRRMEIALRANDEITNQLSEEKQANARQQQHSSSERERELALLHAQHKEQLSAVESKLKHSQEEHEKTEMQYRMLLNKVDRLLQNAVQFYGKKIRDVEEVTEILSRPPYVASPAPAPVEQQVKGNASSSDQVDKLRAKAKKQRLLLRRAKEESDAQATVIARLQRENADQERKWQQQAKLLEKKYSDTVEGYESKAKEDSAVIQDLTARIEQLKAETMLLKRQVKEAREQAIVPALTLSLPEVN
jgi:hypothetical protein